MTTGTGVGEEAKLVGVVSVVVGVVEAIDTARITLSSSSSSATGCLVFRLDVYCHDDWPLLVPHLRLRLRQHRYELGR